MFTRITSNRAIQAIGRGMTKAGFANQQGLTRRGAIAAGVAGTAVGFGAVAAFRQPMPGPAGSRRFNGALRASLDRQGIKYT